jgi:transcriptional regulator with XRE-family HTH domain
LTDIAELANHAAMHPRLWRIGKGLTLAELAARIGVTAGGLSRYERGQRMPARRIMSRFLQETKGEVTANDFFHLDKLARAQAGVSENVAESFPAVAGANAGVTGHSIVEVKP